MPTPSKPLAPQVLEKIDYDAHGKLKFDPANALFRDGPGAFPVTFFHLGRFFQTPVRMRGAREFRRRRFPRARCSTTPRTSRCRPTAPRARCPRAPASRASACRKAASATKRKPDRQKNDRVALPRRLGPGRHRRAVPSTACRRAASRSRVAVPDRPEEFPAFTRVYFETPAAGNTNSMTVYALLEGPSITGVFKFVMQRGKAVIMDSDDRACPCAATWRAWASVPLTSMYWYSGDRQAHRDRLAPSRCTTPTASRSGTARASASRRPLNNPTQSPAPRPSPTRVPRASACCSATAPSTTSRTACYYEKRPSLWVEPLGDWGEGSVQLIEIPTDDEIHDNIVAFWAPKADAKAGASYNLKYRLHWTDQEPYPSPLARAAWPRASGAAASRASRGRRARCASSWSSSSAPLANIPFGVEARAGAHGLARQVLLHLRGGRAQRRHRPLARAVRLHGRGQRAGRHAPVPEERRPDTDQTWLYQYQPG